MKDKILQLFKNNEDDYISGEKISNYLGVSRTAVWKNINILKKEGYIFESSSKKGYKLLSSPNILTKEEIINNLKTNFIGRKIHHFETINSTNNKAKELASDGAEDETVIISEEQTAGKGRLGKAWVSPKHKGIWMSIILRPNINPIYASRITLIGAAAVFNAIKELGIKTSIKWPNDIVLNNKKICGILTEMSAELNKIHYLVIGIGINVNISQDEFPEELKNIASSLKIESNQVIDRKKLASSLLNNFEELYKEFLIDHSIKSAVKICRENSILLGKEINIINNSNSFKAKALDITEDGELLVEFSEGRTDVIFSGEVSVRGLYGYV